MNVFISLKGIAIGGTTSTGTIWGMGGDWLTIIGTVVLFSIMLVEQRQGRA